jgi:GcrA cell cycle regulator
MPNGLTTWDDAAEETLRGLWYAGASQAVIAQRMNRSRNAVAGKIARMGLHRPERPTETAHARSDDRPARRRVIRKINPGDLGAVPMLAAKEFHCRSVLDRRGDDGLAMYCGKQALIGSSWCADHHARYYNKRGS